MTMIQPKNKELTVKQYEFYKRKGLSDEKVMKLHGYHTASLNAWKKENNLIGVKFEPEVKITGNPNTSVDEKPLLKENSIKLIESAPKPIKTHQAQTESTEKVSELEKLVSSLRSDLKDMQKEKYEALERGDAFRDEKLEADKMIEQLESKLDAADNAHDREMEKIERSHEIEVSNLKHELRMQDKALEKHAGLENLNVMLMKQCVNFAERVVSE